jgi:phosphate transport system permease protein
MERQLATHRTGASQDLKSRALTALGVTTALMAPGVAVFLLLEALSLAYEGALGQLWTTEWFPTEDQLGLLPLLAGSLSTSALGLGMAVPLGLLCAIWIQFYASASATRLGETVLGILAGTPSVVFGLFGTYWLLPWFGPSLLAAGLVLALMVLPTFALFALAALRQVPVSLLHQGGALGVSKSRVILHLVLRAAAPGIVAAGALALAREMVAGNVAQLPTSLLSPVRTLTTTLVQEFEYAHGPHAHALHLLALGVVVLAGVLTAAACKAGRGMATQRAVGAAAGGDE